MSASNIPYKIYLEESEMPKYWHSYFKASPDSHFAFLHFFSMGMVLIPVSCKCHEPHSIVH